MSAADTPNSRVPASSLVGDLESLRSLLAEDADTAPAGAAPKPASARTPSAEKAPDDEARAPVLDDRVQGTLPIDESPIHERDPVDRAVRARIRSGLGDDTIKELLGDEWRLSADRILSTARGAIENVAHAWSPQQTTELNQALRVRIDATLEIWLQQLIHERLDDLRSALLAAIEAEIAAFTDQLEPRDPDGD